MVFARDPMLVPMLLTPLLPRAPAVATAPPRAATVRCQQLSVEKLGLDDECRPRHGGGAQGYAATFGPSGGVSRGSQGGSEW